MATFNIKRGDSMPPLIVAMRVAGSDPEEFWDFQKDDVGGILEDNAEQPSGEGVIKVKFIMTNLATGEIVGLKNNVEDRYTGPGEMVHKIVGYENNDETKPIYKTLLRYNWQPAEAAYDPNDPQDDTVYRGDTAVAGVYKGEFEIYYGSVGDETVNRKRTFPVTPGDLLIINVLPDDNDRRSDESE